MGYTPPFGSSKYGNISTPSKKEVEKSVDVGLDDIVKELSELINQKRELEAKKKEIEQLEKQLDAHDKAIKEKVDKLPEDVKEQLRTILKVLFPNESKDIHKE